MEPLPPFLSRTFMTAPQWEDRDFTFQSYCGLGLPDSVVDRAAMALGLLHLGRNADSRARWDKAPIQRRVPDLNQQESTDFAGKLRALLRRQSLVDDSASVTTTRIELDRIVSADLTRTKSLRKIPVTRAFKMLGLAWKADIMTIGEYYLAEFQLVKALLSGKYVPSRNTTKREKAFFRGIRKPRSRHRGLYISAEQTRIDHTFDKVRGVAISIVGSTHWTSGFWRIDKSEELNYDANYYEEGIDEFDEDPA